MSPARRVATVLLPFAAGFFLSYVFRTINAAMWDRLAGDLHLGAGELGLITSAYFIAFAALQLPIGIWLDRYGPRRVQIVLLLVASTGAMFFAVSNSSVGLIVGRALIGAGFAGSLMAGLKAIVLWFPPQRAALASGWFMTLGALGAVAATVPVEQLLPVLGWRAVIVLFAGLTVLVAIWIALIVPEHRPSSSRGGAVASVNLRTIYRDPRFWRLAPLSATCIGASWALHGLWVAPWLAEVERLERADVVRQLFVIALALSASGLVLGAMSDRLQRRGVPLSSIIAGVSVTSIAAQLALVLGSPLPAWLPWCLIAGAGTATVLSYARLGEIFPNSASGRANGALNVLHFGAAFVLQLGVGAIVDIWPAAAGHHPPESYRAALGVVVALQVISLTWYLAPSRVGVLQHLAAHPIHTFAATLRLGPDRAWPYWQARRIWSGHLCAARDAAAAWRLAAIGSAGLCAVLSAALVVLHARVQALPYLVAVE